MNCRCTVMYDEFKDLIYLCTEIGERETKMTCNFIKNNVHLAFRYKNENVSRYQLFVMV